MNNKTLNILEKLISFQSVTPKGLDAIEYVSDLLNNLGFQCEIKSFGEGEAKTTNLYAIYGDNKPNICFAGHLDVVSPMNRDLWHNDPFTLKIVNDIVYGRGTVDMKGAIACALAATIAYLAINKPKGSVSFLLTTDEEGDAKYGTKMMLEHIKNYKPSIDFCVLGEPTSINKLGDTVKIGRRGSVNFNLTVIGQQGHTAYPEKAKNPLPIIVNILKELNDTNFDNGSEFFQNTNLEVTSIDTENYVTNIIPESVTTKFNIRFNDLHGVSSLNKQVTGVIKKYTSTYSLEYKSSSTSFIQKYSSNMRRFVKLIEDECKIKPNIETNGGTSDARFIHKYTEVIEFGLNCNLAHKINEHTTISDLQTLYNVYYITLADLH